MSGIAVFWFMKPFYCIILLLSISVACDAQNFVFPTFDKTSSAGNLAPTGWRVKDSVYGDLNKDGRADLAIVLEYADTVKEIRPDSMENTDHPRILVVLFQDSATGLFRPICQNNTFIIREGEGGMELDPYGSLGISNGILSVGIEFLHERVEYKFRWQKGDIYLIGATQFGFSGVTHDSEGWDFNFSTSKLLHTWQKGDEGKKNSEWKTFSPRSIRLGDMRQYGAMEILYDVWI
jgi:hypothetical protein